MREEQQKAKLPTGYDRLCQSARAARSGRALPGFSEQPVVRMLIPDDAPLVFDDVIRGEVKAPRPDDQVIIKADGLPTYHLANVVDDHEMGITHVVRGEEWISSTPKHVLLYDWLGWERPAFAHMPLLRNTDKSKISKRKNPAARLMWFREQGYLPEALVNFLALMGYSQPDGEEIFTFDDMVEIVRLGAGQRGRARSSTWTSWPGSTATTCASCRSTTSPVASSSTCLGPGVLPAEPTAEQRSTVLAATPLVNERMQVLSEAEGMLAFLLVDDDAFAVDPEAAAEGADRRRRARPDGGIAALEPLDAWATAAIEAALRASLVEGLGIKPKLAFGPVRVAVTGRRVSPPLFESLELLGRERSLSRLRAALALAGA